MKLLSSPPQFNKRLKKRHSPNEEVMLILRQALTKMNSPPQFSVPKEKQKPPDKTFTEIRFKI